MSAAADRTERATPKRRNEARSQGQAARSTELNSVVVLFVGLILTLWMLPYVGSRLAHLASYFFENYTRLSLQSVTEARELWFFLAREGLPIIAPILVAILVAGTGVAAKQVGLRWDWPAMKFRIEKLNILQGMKARFASMNQLVELGKNLLKVGMLGTLAFFYLRSIDREVLAAMLLDPLGAWTMAADLVLGLAIRMLGALLILAFFDVWWQKHRFEESIKMSKQEVKQEGKDAEGDPKIKARIRSMMLEILRQRMFQDTANADVVVTNPTHLSIALKYEDGEAAPRVVAKGKGFLALRIREIAKENGVPLFEDKPLARALYKAVKVGGYVPAALFESVARVLAYVYQQSGKSRMARA